MLLLNLEKQLGWVIICDTKY